MLDFCQPVSYYAKLSVLWVKKLLSEVEPLTYSPISPTTYPLSDSLSYITSQVINQEYVHIHHKGADIGGPSFFQALQDCICRASVTLSISEVSTPAFFQLCFGKR